MDSFGGGNKKYALPSCFVVGVMDEESGVVSSA